MFMDESLGPLNCVEKMLKCETNIFSVTCFDYICIPVEVLAVWSHKRKDLTKQSLSV